MKNITKLAISVVFFVSLPVAMLGSWYVMWEVYGPVMIGVWLLAASASGVVQFVNMDHALFGVFRAANLGLNIGLLITYAVAMFTLVGLWAFVIMAAFSGIALAYHWSTENTPAAPMFGATSVWSK
jgi:hypothetical protein